MAPHKLAGTGRGRNPAAQTDCTVEQASATMGWWLHGTASVREHRLTRRRPIDARADEVEQFHPLPERPCDDRELACRLMDSYGYTAFDGNRYRAPVPVGQRVHVLASEEEVEIASGPARRAARHPRGPHNAGARVPPPSKHRKLEAMFARTKQQQS